MEGNVHFSTPGNTSHVLELASQHLSSAVVSLVHALSLLLYIILSVADLKVKDDALIT